MAVENEDGFLATVVAASSFAPFTAAHRTRNTRPIAPNCMSGEASEVRDPCLKEAMAGRPTAN